MDGVDCDYWSWADAVQCLPPLLAFTWLNTISNHHFWCCGQNKQHANITFSLVAPILLRCRSPEGHTRSRQRSLRLQSTSFLEPSGNNAQLSTPQPHKYSVTSSGFGVLDADIHGSIHLLNTDFDSINRWVAHVSGRVTCMVERQGVLVTLGVHPISLSLQIHVAWRPMFRKKITSNYHSSRSGYAEHIRKRVLLSSAQQKSKWATVLIP